MQTEAQKRASEKWKKANYATSTLNVPKDEMELIKNFAEKHNTTVNNLLRTAVLKYITETIIDEDVQNNVRDM